MADKFLRGDTVRITAAITDTDAAAANPSVSTVVRIMDPNGERQVEDTAMTNLATGSYDYHYKTAATADLGEWTYEIWGTDGDSSYVTIAEGTFELAKRQA